LGAQVARTPDGAVYVQFHDKARAGKKPGTGSASRYLYLGSQKCSSWSEAADLVQRWTGRRPNSGARKAPRQPNSPLHPFLSAVRPRIPDAKDGTITSPGPLSPVARRATVAQPRQGELMKRPDVAAKLAKIQGAIEFKGPWVGGDEIDAWAGGEKRRRAMTRAGVANFERERLVVLKGHLHPRWVSYLRSLDLHVVQLDVPWPV
jgi:hypothetical protein